MYYPVSLKVKGEGCLVVGGGNVALRKTRSLLKAGARVRVVSPRLHPGFRGLRIKHVRRKFVSRDVTGVLLVISAADDEAVNRAVHRACRRRGIPVNVVDRPELCTFIVPSVIRRGPVSIAISTGATSPALAKAMRRELQRLAPASLGRKARAIGRTRRGILRAEKPSPARTRRIKALARGPVFRKAASR